MQANEMITERSNGAQAVLERSQQRIKDIAELMGGTS